MKVLARTQKVLTWLCVCPVDEVNQFKAVYILFSISVLGTLLCALASSIVFVFKYASTNLEQALHALFVIAALTTVVIGNIIMFKLRPKMIGIFAQLSEIYEANKNEESFKFLKQVDALCDWLWTLYFYVMAAYLLSSMLMSGVSVVVCFMLHGDFDADRVLHPFRLVMPWDYHTPLGYAGEILFGMMLSEAYLIGNGSILMLFVCICLHHKAFFSMFKHSVNKLNETLHERNPEVQLCDLIKFHISIKSWFTETAKVYSLFILNQLICNMLHLACVVFQLDLQLKHIDFGITIMAIAVCIGVSNLFLHCFAGKMATESYEDMIDVLYQSDWIKMPIHLQKYFILFIGYAQRPMYYDGFGVAILNMETFAAMIKTVYSYYMIFKTATE